ncbi:MAG: OmpA family protein [Prosthecobacter sp.]|uniref:OmpA family protein n=1 Tax=Prosthecobacter sp. TaxID=1965333 RepID=UPI002619D077|nr:OmpA family protein [Prosthecobacter sp.]MCF7789615.1 OmpA family protein [Prosthecobacter sp.]
MAAVTHPPEWTTPQSSFRSREDWSLKWWVMFALILSVVFHMMLVVGFDTLGISDVTPTKLREVPERMRISEQKLKVQEAIQTIPEIIAPGNVPDMKAFEPKLDDFDKLQELPMNQEIDLSPNVKEITNFIRANDPGDGAPGMSKGSDMAKLLAPQTMDGPDIAAEMASVRRDVLSKPVSEKQMLLDAGAVDPGEGGKMDSGLLNAVKSQSTTAASGARVKGFSNLDDLLGGGGKMGGSTAPILMPTDLLFEYGSDQLAEAARLSLMKLGFLIQKNPDSLFIIEGHTDSFGGDDYNLELSMRRATAVVSWLRESLGLGTDRIQAMGMGKSKPIVSVAGNVEQQEMNRRVEIKVRPKK